LILLTFIYYFNHCILLNFLQAWIYDHFKKISETKVDWYKEEFPRGCKCQLTKGVDEWNGDAVVDGSNTPAQHHMKVLRGSPTCVPVWRYYLVLQLDQVWADQGHVFSWESFVPIWVRADHPASSTHHCESLNHCGADQPAHKLQYLDLVLTVGILGTRVLRPANTVPTYTEWYFKISHPYIVYIPRDSPLDRSSLMLCACAGGGLDSDHHHDDSVA
jgi:hypothetical protein